MNINPKFLRFCGFTAGVIYILWFSGCNGGRERHERASAVSQFKIEQGFDIRLIASEPLLEDPVDMEIDELGNMYVVELTGNPLNTSGTGKVKLLKDLNGDGIMDKSFVFAAGLRLPNGITRWKKGVLVTDPPNVFYFEDTNDDNIADKKEIILTGFDSTDVESNVNNPYYGIDNWIYSANGGKGGPGIHYASHTNGPVLKNNAGGQRIRFRPDSFQLEALSGESQFGHTEDIAGHPLLVENSIHIYEEIIAAKYLNRNPDLLVSSATELIADHSNEVFPTTVNPENQLLTDVGVFTAACGITAYLGGAFGKEYDSTVFVAEPAHNLVHVDKLLPKGASHKASRMDSAREFLTSTDPWFRPVNFYIGPDGALYVVDYYRQFIEGPAFMDEEVLKTANLYNGNDKGRIYRITKKTVSRATTMVDSSMLRNKNLLQKLSDKNIWWRRTAQRLIIDRQANELVPDLKNIIFKNGGPLGKLHALWTLEGLNKLSADVVLNALKDTTNYVRENAIKLAELHFLNDPTIRNQLFAMSDDPDARVRFQLTCSLGEIKNPEARNVIELMLFKYIDDPWMQIAALTSVGSKENLLNVAINKYDPASDAYPLLVERLGSMITSAATTQKIAALLKQAIKGNHKWQPPLLKGIAQGLEGNKNVHTALDNQRTNLMAAVLNHQSNEVRSGVLNVLKVIGVGKAPQSDNIIQRAEAIALDSTVDASKRAIAVQMIALASPASHFALFSKLLDNNEPVIVQLAAINALSAIPGTSSSEFIIKKWNTLTPGIKDEAINTLMSDRARVAILLDAIKSGKIASSLIGWPRSVQLMAGRWPKPGELTSEDSLLIKKARELLSKKETPKKELIKQYTKSSNAGADKALGKKVFSENCALCHQVNKRSGVKLGPDLSTVRNWNPVELVTKILDPNQSIKGGYELWNITLTNGQYLQGIISSETATAITINNISSVPRTIARKDIKSLSSSGTTIMPAGFENQITKEEMAGLIAYLKNE